MMAQSKSRFQGAALAVLAAVILTQCSCNIGIEMDPATTVTVKITGVRVPENLFAVRKAIEDRLRNMADSADPLMTTTSSGDRMTVRLSPVDDVAKFARQISFGEVTDVDGRTVMVRFLK